MNSFKNGLKGLAVRKDRSGQILIIFAFVLLGLLAFTALAVDGGMFYADRRLDQNSADAAALAGAGTTASSLAARGAGGTGTTLACGSASVQAAIQDGLNAAVARAQANGFPIDLDASDNNGATAQCTSDYIDIQVQITTTTSTNFLHLFSNQPLTNKVSATARLQGSAPALAGYSLYVTDDNCSNQGIYLKGGGHADPVIEIQDGGAFSRSCLNGNNPAHNFIEAESISCLKNGGTSYDCGNKGKFSPKAEYVTSDPGENFKIDIPDCSNRTIAPARFTTSDTLEPGYYTDVRSANHLKPGLYCIDSSDGFPKTLETIPGNGYDEGVTIVFMKSGDFSYTGQAKWNIKAAKPGGNNAPNVIPGAVIVSNANYTLDFGGNGQASFWGTVYSPNAHFKIGGTADEETVSSQIFVHDFYGHGTTTLSMKYDSSWFYQKPATLSLHK